MDDTLLLHRFVHERSDAAFETLVQRHAGLVYSAALRQTADPHLAEDVTQAVFIVLSRKASSLSANVILSAWLLTTTRLTVLNVRRQQALRRRVEQSSATMAAEKIQLPAPEDWAAVAPLLDEVIAGLSDADRTAVVLRFFEQCSLADVGRRLGISAGAAEKRVARAVEKLRTAFARRGVTIAGFVLATMLTQHAVQAAPAALTAALPAALAASTGAQLSAAAAVANGAMKVMAMTQAKQVALCAVVLISLAAAGGGILYWSLPPAVPSVPVFVKQSAEPLDTPPPENPEPHARPEVAIPVNKAPVFVQDIRPPEPAPVQPPPAEIVPQPGINLLSRIDVNDAVNGKWSIEDGDLLSDRTSYSRFEIPYVPPPEYDFHVNFTMLEPRDEIAMICAHNGIQFAWKFGSHGNQVIALDQHGGEVPGSRTALGNPFQTGQRYDLTVQVRNNILAAYVNNKLAISYETNYRNLSLNMFWKLPNKNTLGVGTWGTRVRYHTIEIVEVAGRGRFLRAEGQPAIAKPQPQLPPEERWKEAVDLMPLIDPQRDAVAGKWWKWTKAGDGGLSCSAGPATRLEIPYQLPPEYDLKLVVSRQAGKQDLDVILGRDGKSLSWMFGRDNKSAGFQLWSNSSDYINNPTVARLTEPVVNGRSYTMVLQMRKNSFCCFVDGELLSSFNDGSAFGLLKGWTLPTPGRLGIGANQSSATFHTIQLLPITGEGAPANANPNRAPAVTEGVPADVLDLGKRRQPAVNPEGATEQKAQKPPAPPARRFLISERRHPCRRFPVDHSGLGDSGTARNTFSFKISKRTNPSPSGRGPTQVLLRGVRAAKPLQPI